MKNQDDLTQASIQTSVTRSWWELWSPCATFTSPTTLRWSSASLWEGKCKRCCCPTNSLQTYTTNTKEHGLWRSVGQKVSYQSFGPRSKSFIPCFRMGTILWQAWTPHAACPYVCTGMLGKSWVKKMVNFSWSSLLRCGNTKDSSYWVWGMLEKIGVTAEGPEAAHMHRSSKNKTLNEFFRILRWSFYWLWMGLWPSSDVDGKKYLGCITFVFFPPL